MTTTPTSTAATSTRPSGRASTSSTPTTGAIRNRPVGCSCVKASTVAVASAATMPTSMPLVAPHMNGPHSAVNTAAVAPTWREAMARPRWATSTVVATVHSTPRPTAM